MSSASPQGFSETRNVGSVGLASESQPQFSDHMMQSICKHSVWTWNKQEGKWHQYDAKVSDRASSSRLPKDEGAMPIKQ